MGLLIGVVAVAFIRLLDRLEQFVERHVRIHPVMQPMVGGLLIGLIGLAFPQIFGLG